MEMRLRPAKKHIHFKKLKCVPKSARHLSVHYDSSDILFCGKVPWQAMLYCAIGENTF